jgi:hypothetical protein
VETMTTNPNARYIKTERLYYSGDTIYSYGSHFVLARAIRDPKTRATILFLLNGDTISVTTGRHQREIRDAVLGSPVPHVIIPFSAIDAASIESDSIRLLEATDDRTVTTNHVSATMPEGAVWSTVEDHAYVDLSEAQIEAKLDAEYVTDAQAWCRNMGQNWLDANPEPPARNTRESLPRWEAREYVKVGEHRELRSSRSRFAALITVTTLDDGTTRYTWETTRHWLGESLIEGTVISHKRFHCRLCKGSGVHADAPPRPADVSMYELRDITPLTADGRDAVWEASDALVRAWESTWGRRGDMRCERCHGRGTWTREFKRTSKYLSGFDRGENRPSYFFCELPPTDAATVEDALEALKPDTVRIAEQMERTVLRQGDIFAVELSGQVTKRTLRTLGARFEKAGRLFGTNHQATETAILPDGTLIARGCLRHVPDFGRAPDHARVSLGDGWKVIVKNTVPLTK